MSEDPSQDAPADADDTIDPDLPVDPVDPDLPLDSVEDRVEEPPVSTLLARWSDAQQRREAPTERPRSRWWFLVAALGAVAVVVVGFVTLTGSDGDAPAPDDRRSAAAVLAEDVPTVDDLVSDVTVPPGPEEGIRVVDVGATVVVDRFDDTRYEGSVAVIVDNPHAEWTARGVQLTVEVVGPDGAVVTTERLFIDVLLPGQRGAVGAYLFDVPAIDAASARVAAIEVARWTETGPVEGRFVVRDVVTGPGELTGVRTTFTVTSGFADAVYEVNVTVVYRDASGRVIGGYDSFLDRVDPAIAESAVVALLANIDPATIASTEIYPAVGYGFDPGT